MATSIHLTRTKDGKRTILHTLGTADAAKAIASLWVRDELPAGLALEGYIAGKTWELSELMLGEEPYLQHAAKGAWLLDELLHNEHKITHILVLEAAREALRGLVVGAQ